MLEGKTILITGGAGFIGGAIAARLVEKNQVIVYDDLSRSTLDARGLRQHPNLALVEGDVRDRAKLRAATATAHVVIHCAAVNGVELVYRSALRVMSVDYDGTAAVLDAADAVDRIVIFSSSEIFGRYAQFPLEDNPAVIESIDEPRWAYAASKRASEHLAIAYFKERRRLVTIVRPFNVYGPAQVGPSAVRTFVQRALLGLPLEVHGTGEQSRSWCYIDDMVDGALLAATHPAAIGQAFNIGRDAEPLSVVGLARKIIELSGSRSEIRHVPPPYADVSRRCSWSDKARRLLGYKAKVDLDTGLLRTIEWYRSHP